MLTVFDSPGFKSTRSQPAKRRNASPAESGNEAYTCAISAPARLPVLLTEKLTVV